MNTNTARDLTQAERMDALGTVDMDELIAICIHNKIAFNTRKNRAGVIIWRCHLPGHLELKLQGFEAKGRQYTDSYFNVGRAA
ncbi:hypothetical protein [uncultured Paraglaciecola sp.]|uniref:hypothetical protein n=1 Tax=uncultured Paraglaciecola sp. TaxID=1765024 RepID=UPI0026215CBB|nr:hypothetical protein [uncultured Paraglaciecola sp.]